MPPPNVAVPSALFLSKCDRHSKILAGLEGISDPKLKRLLAELVMMRLFDDFQEALEGIATRLACGAPYVDGAPPVLLVAKPAASVGQAIFLFENPPHRPKFQRSKWSKYSFINDTVKHVLDSGDYFVDSCRAHSQLISEMQAIRNRIAHATAQSYPEVVRRYYGATFNHVTPGVLLLSARFAPPLLEKYIATCRVIVKSCSRS